MPGLKNGLFKQIFIIFFSLLLIILVNEKLEKQNALAYATANLGLTIFCVMYYYKLFNDFGIVI